MKRLTLFETLATATNKGAFASVLVLLRFLVGVEFLMAGVAKLGGWSAQGYLEAATGPLAGWFQSLAGNALVDQLNLWGPILIGLALLIGLMVRPASFFGGVMMLLYYLAQFDQNTAHGFIDEHVILLIVFLLFLCGGAGHIVGLDGIVSRHFRKRKWAARVFFG